MWMALAIVTGWMSGLTSAFAIASCAERGCPPHTCKTGLAVALLLALVAIAFGAEAARP